MGLFVVIGCSFLYRMTPKRKVSQQHGAEWVFTEIHFRALSMNAVQSVLTRNRSLASANFLNDRTAGYPQKASRKTSRLKVRNSRSL
ncbi:MAG: hypothetical protein ACJ746_19915, partial [Bryobacteraceae bacterium]